MKTKGNEALESQVNDQNESFGKTVDSASQNQVIGGNTDNRIKIAADSAVIAVDNCMHDVISTAMNNVVNS